MNKITIILVAVQILTLVLLGLVYNQNWQMRMEWQVAERLSTHERAIGEIVGFINKATNGE